jgi:hypothetical protein
MASIGFRRDNFDGGETKKANETVTQGGTATDSGRDTCSRARTAVNFRMKMPRPRLFTISSIGFFMAASECKA